MDKAVFLSLPQTPGHIASYLQSKRPKMYASTSAHKVAYQPLTASPNFIDLRGVGHKRA